MLDAVGWWEEMMLPQAAPSSSVARTKDLFFFGLFFFGLFGLLEVFGYFSVFFFFFFFGERRQQLTVLG